jgi:hypothetical protein
VNDTNLNDFAAKPKKNIIFVRNENGTHICSEEEMKIWRRI